MDMKNYPRPQYKECPNCGKMTKVDPNTGKCSQCGGNY